MASIVTVGEALVEIMRPERDVPLNRPGPFSGPYPSGAPAIFAGAAARLGASVGFVGTVGHDAFGDCVLDRLRSDGVDVSAVRRESELLTGIAFVAYAADGTRSFIFHLPRSAAAHVTPDQLPAGYVDEIRYLHVMGSSLSISEELRKTCYALAHQVYENGGTVSLDPNLRPELLPEEEIRAVCDPVVEVAEVVLPSGEELASLTGEKSAPKGAERLLARGVEIVALKRGARGSRIYTKDETIDIPPYQVKEVDPTGAGDCYDAAFVVGLSRYWPLEATARYANAAGALATTRLGPMEGTFDHEYVTDFMASQGAPLPPSLRSAS
ncbi:MAG: sugar kinase [Chloroflexota bacterium]|nr:sugar kinase [Chloroflexota bacterium]